MTNVILWGVISMLATYWLTKQMIPVLILAAYRYQLYDLPDGERKLHAHSTPTLGGIAIFLSFMIAFSFMMGVLMPVDSLLDLSRVGFLMAAAMLLFGIGLKDDVIGVSAKYKLTAQIIASGLVIFGLGLNLQSLGGLFGIHEIPYAVGFLLTLFTIIVLINAYNLIDGIDGLAGGIATVASLFFGSWFLYAGYFSLAMLSFVLVAAILGFLWYNMSPARIFMGDTGSLLIGFFLAVQALSFVNLGLFGEHDHVVYWQSAAPVLAMAVLIVPMYDTMRVFMIRIFRGKSPFDPDRSHLHHLLLDLGCSHRKTMYLLCGFTVVFVGVGLFLALFLTNTQLFFVLLALALVCLPTNWWKTRLLRRVAKTDPITIYLKQNKDSVGYRLLKEEAKQEEREAELV